jgi:hypothetical protein
MLAEAAIAEMPFEAIILEAGRRRTANSFYCLSRFGVLLRLESRLKPITKNR